MAHILPDPPGLTSEGVPVGSGYSIAGRIDVGYDGGNHPIRADYLRCRSCGCLLLATDQGIHERLHEAIDVTALAFIAKAADPGPVEAGR